MNETTLKLFEADCQTTYHESKAFLINADAVTLDWNIVVTAGPSLVEWYMEFTSDNPLSSSATWYREVAEEDGGNGVTLMPEVTRKFTSNGVSTGLTAGTHNLSTQLIRKHRYVHLKIRCNTGRATVTVVAPFGLVASAP